MTNPNSIEAICMGCFTQHESPVSPCPKCGCVETAQTLAPHQLRPRTILNGKYLLGMILGEGGFGITYIGWDLNLHLKVAIKEYYPNGFVTRETTSTTTVQPFVGSQGDFFRKGRERFVEEARSLARFRSLPGIVAVNDFFQENGTAYIVMEYIEGQTLKEYLARVGGKLPCDQLFEMMKPVMASLSEVHKSGMIHRDISPDNIMMCNEGHMKLLDFGAAREFAESGNKSLSIMLKPGFAPEEQYRSKGVQGPWTDVYALSASMYKCLTGVTPDESSDRVYMDSVMPPSALGIAISPVQEAALMKGMGIRREDRYQSMAELSAALFGGAGAAVSAGAGDIPVAAGMTVPMTVPMPVPPMPSAGQFSGSASPELPPQPADLASKKIPLALSIFGYLLTFFLFNFSCMFIFIYFDSLNSDWYDAIETLRLSVAAIGLAASIKIFYDMVRMSMKKYKPTLIGRIIGNFAVASFLPVGLFLVIRCGILYGDGLSTAYIWLLISLPLALIYLAMRSKGPRPPIRANILAEVWQRLFSLRLRRWFRFSVG